jgi:hypothetical protein
VRAQDGQAGGFGPAVLRPLPHEIAILVSQALGLAIALSVSSPRRKLPTTDRRPRFRLSTEQAGLVATLLEVDTALATAGLDPSWLHNDPGRERDLRWT